MKKSTLNILEAVLTMYRKEPWMSAESFAIERDTLYGAYRVNQNNYISYGKELTDDEKYAIIATQRSKPLRHFRNNVVTAEVIDPTAFFFMHIGKNDVGKVIWALTGEDEDLINERYWERWCSLSDGIILNDRETEKLTTMSVSGEVVLTRDIFPADVCSSGKIYTFPT